MSLQTVSARCVTWLVPTRKDPYVSRVRRAWARTRGQFVSIARKSGLSRAVADERRVAARPAHASGGFRIRCRFQSVADLQATSLRTGYAMPPPWPVVK